MYSLATAGVPPGVQMCFTEDFVNEPPLFYYIFVLILFLVKEVKDTLQSAL